MRLKNFMQVSTLAVLVFFSSISCSREEINPDNSTPHISASTSAIPSENGDSPESWTCCAVSGTTSYWCDWRSDMVNVLNCCHIEQLEPNCQWWGNNTTTADITYQWSLMDIASPVDANAHIATMANWAAANRPSSYYIITGYSLKPTYCEEGFCCLKLTVTYRSKICEPDGELG